MADPRFFTVSGPFTVTGLAKIAGAALATTADGDKEIADVAPLDDAGEHQFKTSAKEIIE